MARKRKYLVFLVGFVLALAGLRLCLPWLACGYVNRKLAVNPAYRGHVDKIGISLWRGSYQIKDVKIEKLGGAAAVLFFSCERIDLAVEWKPLLRGAVVGNVNLHKPVLNFVKGRTDAEPQTWEQTAKGLAPLTIDLLTIEDGEMHYRDFDSAPQVDLVVSKIFAVAKGLSTVKKKNKPLPVEVEARATCFESGTLTLRIELDPWKKDPTFELKESLTGVQLTNLNDYFEAYGKFRVKGGDFGLYTEVAAKEGGFLGYTKPFFSDVEIEVRDRKGMKKLWAGLVSTATQVLSNPRQDQVATTIPLKGTFDKTIVGVGPVIAGLLKNAFFHALRPALDGTVHIADVKPKSITATAGGAKEAAE